MSSSDRPPPGESPCESCPHAGALEALQQGAVQAAQNAFEQLIEQFRARHPDSESTDLDSCAQLVIGDAFLLMAASVAVTVGVPADNMVEQFQTYYQHSEQDQEADDEDEDGDDDDDPDGDPADLN